MIRLPKFRLPSVAQTLLCRFETRKSPGVAPRSRLQVTALEDRTVPSGGQGGDPPPLSPPIVAISYDVAEQQSFAATIGVGLLNNYSLGSFGSGTAIQSIQLPGSSTTYNTATPIATNGGGTLTVGSNGSFSFIPGSTQTGADTFQFNISDGTHSGFGTVTLAVGGSGLNYGSNNLTAAPAGSLTFSRTLADSVSDDDFIVHDVPFHLATNGTTGVIELGYQLFVGKLAHVDDESTVLLPTITEWTILQSDLRDFKFADGQELVQHIVEVRQAVDVAIEDISASLGPGYDTSAMKGQINRWFKGNGAGAPSAAPTQTQVGAILVVYQGVADNLDGHTITYVNKSDELAYADLYGENTTGEIVIGALYFSDDGVNTTPLRDRFGTVIHELTHTGPSGTPADGTWDHAYFDPDNSFDPLLDVDWRGTTVTTLN